ncbi:uncharacterized protein LOC128323544 [Hemicordylus capensis]|uniref:uncharacterized protein LOC128323544 n=1 Tax=Hemicordylus capensis TaxID=884348 RepID=UPI00230343EC|nr:uncharacterized protein LOC128323544 [Hemicordylus capensis]
MEILQEEGEFKEEKGSLEEGKTHCWWGKGRNWAADRVLSCKGGESAFLLVVYGGREFWISWILIGWEWNITLHQVTIQSCIVIMAACLQSDLSCCLQRIYLPIVRDPHGSIRLLGDQTTGYLLGSHPEAEPKDEDEEGAQTGHPRNPTHVAPCPGGPMLHHVLGDPLGEEPNEATLVPGPLPGLHVPTDILGKELNEETSMLGSLPEPRVPTDILEQELNEEMSVPRSLPEPCITNDILGRELNEATLVPGLLPGTRISTDTLEEMLSEETSMPGSFPGPRIHTDVLEGKLNEATSMPGSLPASHDVPEGPAAGLHPPGSGSSLSSALLEVGSIPPSASTSSFLLHPSSPPPPSPHPLELELKDVKETLQSLMNLQFHQLNDRQRHLLICQEFLQNIKALRGDLRRLQSRLESVEATIEILVPPKELDVEEEKEKDQNQTVLHT